jgi:hypothetical protein
VPRSRKSGAPSSRLAGESDSLVRVDTWQIDG